MLSPVAESTATAMVADVALVIAVLDAVPDFERSLLQETTKIINRPARINSLLFTRFFFIF